MSKQAHSSRYSLGSYKYSHYFLNKVSDTDILHVEFLFKFNSAWINPIVLFILCVSLIVKTKTN